jgi:hypothetical protein
MLILVITMVFMVASMRACGCDCGCVSCVMLGNDCVDLLHHSGKLRQTRAIGANASAEEVGAAVRELVANCEGDNGLPTDSAGNTWECFSERGFTYRGLAHTTVDGEECAPWKDTDFWDPYVVALTGLDGNLCRNPTFDLDLGPWCFNAQGQAKSCAVPRCGGPGEENVKRSPVVASFEDEGASTESIEVTGAAEERDGVVPKIVTGNAFCGSGALYMNNAWGMIKNIWRYDLGKDAAEPGMSQVWLRLGVGVEG